MYRAFLLFCTMTDNFIIITQIITLQNVSTLSCHPQGARNQCFAKYFQRSCTAVFESLV